MRCTASGHNPQVSLVSEYMDKSYETVHVDADVETALVEVPQSVSQEMEKTSGENNTSGLMGRRPIVVVDDERRVVGIITRPHLAMDIAKVQSARSFRGGPRICNWCGVARTAATC